MLVQRTNVYLDEDQIRGLKHLAAEQGLSLAELVRQAVDRLLAGQGELDPSWQERLDRLVARVRSRLPQDARVEGIEEDITVAASEAARARRH